MLPDQPFLDAVSGILFPTATTTEGAACCPPSVRSIFLNMGCRSGPFDYKSYADNPGLETAVADDILQGLYIAHKEGDGAWARRVCGCYQSLWWGFGVPREETTATEQGLAGNQAIINTPNGYTLEIPAGIILVNRELLIKDKGINLKGCGEQGTNIQGIFPADDVTSSVVKIDCEVNNPRNTCISDMTLFAASNGLHALSINSSGTGSVHGHVTQRCHLIGNAANGGRGQYLSGENTVFCKTRDCQIFPGVTLDKVADGNYWDNCTVFDGQSAGLTATQPAGFLIDLVLGAADTTIRNCPIVCRDGAIHVINGSVIIIQGNQIEQAFNANDNLPNQSTYSSHIYIEGRDYQSEDIRISDDNHLGGGQHCDRGIVIDNARDTMIDDGNQFGRFNVADVMTLPAAVYTKIGPDNSAKFQHLNRDRYDWMIVDDQGVGSFGVYKDLVGHQNGWTGGRYIKRPDGIVEFVEPIEGGSTTFNETIAVMPQGFTPATFSSVPVGTFGGPGTVRTHSATNEIRVGVLPVANGNLEVSSIRYQAKAYN